MTKPYLTKATKRLLAGDLRGADLRFVDFRNFSLKGRDLRGADLTGSILSGVNLRDADLRGAVLRGAVLDSRLEGARVEGADFRNVLFWDTTPIRGLLKADLRGAGRLWVYGTDAEAAAFRAELAEKRGHTVVTVHGPAYDG